MKKTIGFYLFVRITESKLYLFKNITKCETFLIKFKETFNLYSNIFLIAMIDLYLCEEEETDNLVLCKIMFLVAR